MGICTYLYTYLCHLPGAGCRYPHSSDLRLITLAWSGDVDVYPPQYSNLYPLPGADSGIYTLQYSFNTPYLCAQQRTRGRTEQSLQGRLPYCR